MIPGKLLRGISLPGGRPLDRMPFDRTSFGRMPCDRQGRLAESRFAELLSKGFFSLFIYRNTFQEMDRSRSVSFAKRDTTSYAIIHWEIPLPPDDHHCTRTLCDRHEEDALCPRKSTRKAPTDRKSNPNILSRLAGHYRRLNCTFVKQSIMSCRCTLLLCKSDQCSKTHTMTSLPLPHYSKRATEPHLPPCKVYEPCPRLCVGSPDDGPRSSQSPKKTPFPWIANTTERQLLATREPPPVCVCGTSSTN